jgi:CHAD domain-containing protein
MSYELRLRQSLGDNLCRMFRKQIDAALDIAHGEIPSHDTRVHALRKHLKKARAALRLVRKEIRGWRRQDRRLRDIGRLVREIRDAEVRVETMRELKTMTCQHYRSHSRIERLLALESSNFLGAFGGWEPPAISLLELARNAISEWRIDDFDWQQLRRAVQRTYKRARKALAVVTANPSVANAHELRKKVKLLGYQLRIIRPLNPVAVDALSHDLTKLGELLGRLHDLSSLGNRLQMGNQATNRTRQNGPLLTMTENTQIELLREAINLATKFFLKAPYAFGLQIEEWMTDAPQTNVISIAKALPQI